MCPSHPYIYIYISVHPLYLSTSFVHIAIARPLRLITSFTRVVFTRWKIRVFRFYFHRWIAANEAPLHAFMLRVWIRVSCSAQGEIKNRCTIGRLFCIIRKRRGGGGEEKREFSNDIRDPFSAFFPLPSLSVWYFAACVFSSLSLSLEWFINPFFLFITRKRDRSPFRVVEQDSRGGWKLALLSPLLHESLWKLKGCLGGTQKRVTLITDRLFSGPRAGRKSAIRTLFAQKRRLNGISINYFAIQFRLFIDSIHVYRIIIHTHA